MITETRHAGLTADERSEIRSTVLETRQLIEDDLYRQLQRYGVYEDERVDLDQLGHLSPADKEIRRTVDAAIDRELEATGGIYQRSVKNYVREATKTELNRLVALKAIEVRGLVSETLTERPEYGNRSELVRAVDEVAGELTDRPDGGMGTALLLAFTELSDEIGVIFEESEHTAIELDFAVREDLIDALNGLGYEIWKSDEAMGWVYQYFGEKERDEIDERIDEENYKVQDTDVATKTQLFTPRYIVEWMVDNSLGRLWLEMHGENTSIDDEDKCFYLAPLEDALIDRPQKDVRDIKVLDPACGSGHMLFYAFDVLYEMYLEQADVPEKYIPREILKNNLYGIDIDPGAAQIAALALYVKAKREEPDVDIEGINIVSADAVLVNGEKKDEVLARTDTDLERRVLKEVWTSFEHIREWGSLVRIEERIEGIIEEEIEEVQATGQARFADDGLVTQSSVVSYSGEEETWAQVKARLLDQVSELAEEALEQNDPIEELFADEVEKSVRLLDLFIGDYDVVVSNPPYLNSAKIGDSLKTYVKDNYLGSRDLYSAFIERCIELTENDNYSSLVTPESFMFLGSFEELRNELVSNVQIIEGAHLSRYGFDQAKDSYTIPIILRNREPGDFESTRIYRMTHKQDDYKNYKRKIIGLRNITRNNRFDKKHDDVYVVNQNIFSHISRSPLVYYLGDELLSLFQKFPKLGDNNVAKISGGIKTGDNDYFLRKFWELPDGWVGDTYQWFIQSGEGFDFYDPINMTIRWEDKGRNVVKYCEENNKNYQGLSDLEWYWDESIVFRGFGNVLRSKYLPDDTLFSNAIYRVKPYNDLSKKYYIGYLNSPLFRYLANSINPSVNFNPTDAGVVPTKLSILDQHKHDIQEIVDDCIESRRKYFGLIETNRGFNPDSFMSLYEDGVDKANLKMDLLNCKILELKSVLDEIIYEIYEISEEKRVEINSSLDENYRLQPHILNSGDYPFSDNEHCSEIPKIKLEPESYEELINSVSETSGAELLDMTNRLEISPVTIALIRYENDLYSSEENRETAARLVSFYLGCIFGRWKLDGFKPVSDGILSFDNRLDSHVENRVRECIELTLDSAYKVEELIEEMLGNDPANWLRHRFFRYHHCKEYRRRGQRIPIYWQLESDDGAFSCFIYYHSMDGETFPKLRGQYIDQKIDTLQNRLDAIDAELDMADGDRARELRSDREQVQTDIDDIREFRERVDRLIDEGFAPDFEAGIWENIQKVDEHDLLAVPLDKL